MTPSDKLVQNCKREGSITETNYIVIVFTGLQATGDALA